MAITLCNCPFQNLTNFRFCGSEVIESEICFVPAVKQTDIQAATISFDVDPKNFKVELVCCNLIVVCGFIKKTITFASASGLDTVTKDIPVQVKVPANIFKVDDLAVGKWTVAGAEVCSSGCVNLVCPGPNTGTPPTATFHKLVEKDVVSVLVKHI